MKSVIRFLFAYFIMLLMGCQNKSSVNHEEKSIKDLDTELENSILEYENNIPIPKTGITNKFIYVVDFALKDKDTIIIINRKSKGLYNIIKYFGIYRIKNEIPVAISDTNNLGKRFIKNKFKNSLLKEFEITRLNTEYDEYPPVYTYVVKKDKINLLRVDTIRNNWIK